MEEKEIEVTDKNGTTTEEEPSGEVVDVFEALARHCMETARGCAEVAAEYREGLQPGTRRKRTEGESDGGQQGTSAKRRRNAEPALPPCVASS